jgi:hypothetical protein
LADKVEKRLMLRGTPRRCGCRRKRFNALAAVSCKQSYAIVAQRPLAIFVADNAGKASTRQIGSTP